jgi:DNA ligase-1
MHKTFKPMLASNVEDFSKLRFPALVSPKLDGVRATVQNGILLSRSLKPIPNKNVQALFKGLPEGLDGELIVGDPSNDPYRRTVSVVMSDDKPVDFYAGERIRFCVFDRQGPLPFVSRLAPLADIEHPDVRLVPHSAVGSVEDLEMCETEYLSRGYEGLMYRDPNGPYKSGRSSEREGWLLKVKRFKDAEAVIIGCEPEMENQNAAFTNELGRTARSSAKAGKVAKDTLGKFNGRGVGGDYDGVEFDIAVSSLTHADRAAYWQKREELVGKVVVYKYFPTGGDTRPRHPIFKGFRDGRDFDL